MGFVTKLDDGRYRARWRTPEGKGRSKTFGQNEKRRAERHWRQKEHEKDAGVYVDTKAARLTFGEYAEQWRSTQVQHRPATVAQVEGNLRRHVLPFLGQRPLGAVRPSEVRAWVRGRADAGLEPSTVELLLRLVATVFRAAVADRLITSSPCQGVKPPKVERRQVEPLAVEAVEALAAAVPDRYRALVVLSAGTGLRQGECFGLTVDRVDFLRRTVRVDRQLVLVSGHGPQLGPPKTDASYRTVPLPQVVLDALAAHLAAYPAGPDGHVFTSERGGPIRRNRFSEVWRPAVAAAGLPEGTGFHDLRHFYASLLIRHGESVKTVQARLGHASATETLDTYSHLWPDSDDQTRQAVDTVFHGSRVTSASRTDTGGT